MSVFHLRFFPFLYASGVYCDGKATENVHQSSFVVLLMNDENYPYTSALFAVIACW